MTVPVTWFMLIRRQLIVLLNFDESIFLSQKYFLSTCVSYACHLFSTSHGDLEMLQSFTGIISPMLKKTISRSRWYHVFFFLNNNKKFFNGLKQKQTKEGKTHKGKKITWQRQPNTISDLNSKRMIPLQAAQ